MTSTMKKLTVLLVGMLFVLCTAMALVVGLPASTAFAASTTSYSIGDTVEFAGYEWYIIGNETEGVTAPSGCYTLFAKNDEFGSTTFDNVDYKDSTLCQAIGAISGDFSSPYLANIVPRDTFDGISGDSPTNQYLWALSDDETESLDVSLTKFATAYWTRTAAYKLISPDQWGYSARYVYADGRFINSTMPTSSYTIRPALYVKASFLKEPNTEPTTEVKEVAFGGEYWYVVGEGSTGSVWGPENTVTLFQNPSTEILAKTGLNYLGSELQQAMANFATTLGLSDKEISLIVPRTLTSEDGISGETAANQPFWALSKDEATAIGNTEILKSSVYNTSGYYWLRTIYEKYDTYSYMIYAHAGELFEETSDGNKFDREHGVRPAFYLDVSDVFYIAKDGKYRSLESMPYELKAYYDRYAYTMFDNNLHLTVNATPTQTTQTGSSLSFGYTASTGEDLRIACVLTDADGNILYYNAFHDLSDSSAYTGMVNIPIGNIRNGNYTLRLYTEEFNYKSICYASQPVDLQIKVENGVTSIVDLGDVTAAPAITGVTVTPTSPSVENGGQQQFSAIVTSAGVWCDQTVNWTVTGARSSGTSISSAGLLTVAEDETATSFTVTATSVQDVSVSSSVTVTVAFTNPKIMLSFNNSVYSYMEMIDAINAISGFETTAEKRAVLKLLDNFDLTSALTFNTGFITLDLNGYMLKQTGSGSVISINEGADFILDDLSGATATHNYYVAEDGLWTFYDGDLPAEAAGAETGVVTGGVITGGNALYGGGVSVYGTFTMNGGTIAGNRSTGGSMNYGGGVYVRGTVTMNGGTISGNVATRGGGVYMGDGSTFTMTDGTISGNVATSGGGVYVNGGTFTMENGYCNIINIANSTFSFTGGNCDSVIISGGTVSISGGYITSINITKGTVSISGGYFAQEFDTAYLAENCVLQDVSAFGGATFDSDYTDGFPYAVYAKAEIMISTEDIVYDGSPVAEGVDFTVEGADGVTLPYSYKTVGGDDFTAGLPTNAGKYTISAYALNEEKQFISIVFDITIAKATYDMSGITFADGNFTYDREAHSIAISGTLPAGVSVSYDVSYKVNAGEYTVTATFTGDSANYNAIPAMTAKLTIAKADYDMSGITFEDGSFTYDGQAHSLAIAGNLPYGVSVNYINNAQVNAGEHTVTAKFTGDYTNYNTIDDMTAMLTIDKAMPVYTTPENLTACIEHTLADVTLPAGWTWEDSTLSVGETGEKQFEAIFTPEDTNNYERALVNVTLTVAEHIDGNDDGICDSCGVKFRNIVTVAGGTIEGVTGSTCTVDENGSVTVVVGEAPEGKEFKGWSVDGGETIISEEAAYTFTASEDITLTAVFADKQSDVKPGGEITPENPEGLSGGAIAGIVIGSVFGALILAYAICAILYKKKLVKGAFFEKIYPFIKD